MYYTRAPYKNFTLPKNYMLPFDKRKNNKQVSTSDTVNIMTELIKSFIECSTNILIKIKFIDPKYLYVFM